MSWWEIAVAELALGRVGGGGSSSPKKAKKGDKQDQEEEEEEGSGTWWRKMHKEATWSRAIYGYGLGVCLYEESLQLSSSSGTAGQDEKAKPIEKEKEKKVKKLREEAAGLMKKVPDLRQRIAGKSIPLEVSRWSFIAVLSPIYFFGSAIGPPFSISDHYLVCLLTW